MFTSEGQTPERAMQSLTRNHKEGKCMYVSGIKTAMSQMHKSLLTGGLPGRVWPFRNHQEHLQRQRDMVCVLKMDDDGKLRGF